MNNFLKNFLKANTTFPILIAIAIFIFFLHTLNYPWKFFDEDIIFREAVLPIPASFKEYLEILKMFGTKHYFESSNPIYSNISNIRGNPIWLTITMFIFYLLKASAIKYHLFTLALHIANAIFCYLILRHLTSSKEISTLLICTLLTLIWALHPTNIEPVLFGTNFGILITFFLCFILFYYFQKLDTVKNWTWHIIFVLPLYFLALSLHEYAVVLPMILIIYLSCIHKKESLTSSLLQAIKNISPMLTVLVLYFIYFMFSEIPRTYPSSNIALSIERILWFSPQILTHYLKLIIFPVKLSVDHAGVVHIAKTYFSPYALFSIGLAFSLVIFSLVYLRHKNTYLKTLAIGISMFFIAILPYLHILSPIYNIASERYLYFPLFIIAFCSVYILSGLKKKNRVIAIGILSVLLLGYGTKAYSRTFAWENTGSLLISAINNTDSYTYKGLRQHMIGTAVKELDSNPSPQLIKNINQIALTYLYSGIEVLRTEKGLLQDKTPSILKFYGLDPKTMEAKTAFLIALTEYDLNNNPQKASLLISNHIDSLTVLDTQLANFYYKVLFQSGKVSQAEELLKTYFTGRKISAGALVAYSDLIEYKYNDLQRTQQYLLKSFKYFPYDSSTLFGLKRIYNLLGNQNEFARFSYLYALRTHDIQSFRDSALMYIALDKKAAARNILEIMTTRFQQTKEVNEIKNAYEAKFGNISS